MRRRSRREFLRTLGAGTGLALSMQRPSAFVGQPAASSKDGVVDVHHHILPPEYVRLVGTDAIGKPAPTGAPAWNIQSSLEFMNEAGIRTAMVSVSAPGLWFRDTPLAVRLARSCNEFAAGMVEEHGYRFGNLAALPLPDVSAGLAELKHAAEVLKCDGICLMTNYGSVYLGDRSLDPVLAEINARQLPVYVHPYVCDCDQDVLPGVPLSAIEFPHSTTRAIVNMLNAGTFTRFPNIPFIFSHAGGTIPFLASRIAGVGTAIGKTDWMAVLRRLHYDTASSANTAAFGPLLGLVNASQVLLGTDFPFVAAAGAARTVTGLTRLGLSDMDLGQIQGANARRLFPRIAL